MCLCLYEADMPQILQLLNVTKEQFSTSLKYFKNSLHWREL